MVTIGIPFYNNETTLKYAVQSVINQTFQDWKLFLINDGSTDQSLEIAKEYESDKIIVLNDGENKGLIYRLNQLIDLCTTKYFVRMDSDDIMVPERLERQISLLEKNPNIDVVGSSAYIINENNDITGIRMSDSSSFNIDDILKNGLFIHPTVTGRTKWFKEFRYKNDFNRAEDLELWCRSCAYSKFINIQEPLLFYRDPLKMNLSKYKASIKTVKKIIRIYANNPIQKSMLLLRENVKIILYTVLQILNCTAITNKRRNSRIEKLKSVQAMIKLQRSIN